MVFFKKHLSKNRLLTLSILLFSGVLLAEGHNSPSIKNTSYSASMLGKFDIKNANIEYINPVSNVKLDTKTTRELVLKLMKTQPVNQAEINQQLNLEHGEMSNSNFIVSNPYYPRNTDAQIDLPELRSIIRDGQEIINPEGYAKPEEGYTLNAAGEPAFFQQTVATRWFSDIRNKNAPAAQQVCAVKFVDAQNQTYEMKTFDSVTDAHDKGWTVTHEHACGTCSTLQDLAVYIGIPNQTQPVSACTRQAQGDINKVEQVADCITEAVGFTQMCAQSWAYNGVHTGASCQADCQQLASGQGKNIMAVNPETGQLNSCLWCDERMSGPGFKYSAGRTRRNSGLASAIVRPNDVLFYAADHSLYFSDHTTSESTNKNDK